MELHAHNLNQGARALMAILQSADTGYGFQKQALYTHAIYRPIRTNRRAMGMQLARLRRVGLALEDGGRWYAADPLGRTPAPTTPAAVQQQRSMAVEVKVGSQLAFMIGDIRVEVRAVP